MPLRKITIAVDCADDAQRDRIQTIMNEIGGMNLLRAEQIEGMYPYFRSHYHELSQLFTLITQGGVKAIASGQGLSIISKLARR